MLRERCERDDAPLWLTSMIPSPTLLDRGALRDGRRPGGGLATRRGRRPTPERSARRRARRRPRSRPRIGRWTATSRSRCGGPPASGYRATVRLRAVRRAGAMCDLRAGRRGGGRDVGVLATRHEPRAKFCRSCGATNLKRVRVGVTTLARDVAAQLSQPVSEVTAATRRERAARARGGGHRGGLAAGAPLRRRHLRRLRPVPARPARVRAPRGDHRGGQGRSPRGLASRGSRRRWCCRPDAGTTWCCSALQHGRFEEIVPTTSRRRELLGLPPYGATARSRATVREEFVAGLAVRGVTAQRTLDGFVLRAETWTRSRQRWPPPTTGGEKLRVAVQ